MNILFFHSGGINPVTGGISKITYLIATILRKRSNKVFFLAYEKLNRKYDSKQYFLPDKNLLCDKNVQYLHEIISDNNIQYIINQATLHPNFSKFIFLAKGKKVKIFSVIHHNMFSRFDNVAYLLENKLKKNKLSRLSPILKNKFIIHIIKKIYKFKYYNHFKHIYNSSDKIIAVSHNNIADIQYMYGATNTINREKIIAIDNGIKLPSYIYNSDLKKKTILWIGTTDFYNKRVDVMLEIWNLIQNKIPDWNLKILGDGADLDNAKFLSDELSLQRIEFTGRVVPEKYLKQASILCMTSASESFGLVLLEAMSYGVIPFTFNSFPAASEIIQDGVNGFLIDPFDIQQYAERIILLCLGSDNEKNMIEHQSLQQSKHFDINTIVTEWEKILI